MSNTQSMWMFSVWRPHQIVENCICTLRNLSYRLELELPPTRLIGVQEADAILGSESPSKDISSSCWGRKKKKKKNSQEDTVSVAGRQRERGLVLMTIEGEMSG